LYGGATWYGAVFKLNTAGEETVLHSFCTPQSPSCVDGDYPDEPLARDGKGNLYGTAGGGTGYGTVFKIDTAGKETVLHSFAGPDGCSPRQGLLRDKAGNLYGTTYLCGSSNQGTIFKIDSAGKFSLLHSFAGKPSDGGGPVSGNLTMDAKGNLYGLTWNGGANDVGALYKLSKKGKLTLLYSWQPCGWSVSGAAGTVARDKDGNL
jgi:uncharacterized repeat protein (TIGR03803 family)